MSVLYRLVLSERLPILLPTPMLWSPVLAPTQVELDLLLMVPLGDEQFLMDFADDLLLLVMLASLE